MTMECSDSTFLLENRQRCSSWRHRCWPMVHSRLPQEDRQVHGSNTTTDHSIICEFVPSVKEGDEESRNTLGHEMSTTWDVSKTTYADDFARTFKVPDIDELRGKANAPSDMLEDALALNYGRNRGKTKTLLGFVGKRSHLYTRTAFNTDCVPGNVKSHARYLGPYLACDNRLADEGFRRRAAATAAFHTCGVLPGQKQHSQMVESSLQEFRDSYCRQSEQKDCRTKSEQNAEQICQKSAQRQKRRQNQRTKSSTTKPKQTSG